MRPATSRLLRSTAVLLGAVGLQGVASAKLPEPDAVYFGSLSHKGSTPLVAAYGGQIAVVGKLNGVSITRFDVAAGSGTFVLKTPLDDGLAPRIAGTACAGDRIRVFLVNTGTGAEAEATESIASAGFTISNIRGEITAINLSTSADLSGPAEAPTFATWAQSYASRGLSASAGRDEDFDGDRQSNFAEYVAGTDPTSAGSLLAIRSLVVRNGVASVRFGPVMLSRRYLLESAPTPSGPWVQLGVFRYPAAANETGVDVLAGNVGAMFRVRVEIE